MVKIKHESIYYTPIAYLFASFFNFLVNVMLLLKQDDTTTLPLSITSLVVDVG